MGLSRDVRHGARLRHLRHRTDHGVRQVRRLRQTPRTQGRNLGSVGGGSERVLPAGAKPGDPAARTRRRQGHGAAEKEEVTVQTPGGPAPDLANRSGRYRLLANRTWLPSAPCYRLVRNEGLLPARRTDWKNLHGERNLGPVTRDACGLGEHPCLPGVEPDVRMAKRTEECPVAVSVGEECDEL